MQQRKAFRPGETIAAQQPSGWQHPPGYDIGGDASQDRNAKQDPLPAEHPGAQDPGEFQHPRGTIAGADLAMGESTHGMTDNVLGTSKRADLEVDAESRLADDNPSGRSPNPSEVEDAEPPPKNGFLGRAKGWER